MGKTKKDELLDIFIKARAAALDKAAVKNKDYQNTIEQQKKAFDVLDKAGLNKEQFLIVDRAISAANACGAVYGAVAYRLGVQDGIKLMSELKEIK